MNEMLFRLIKLKWTVVSISLLLLTVLIHWNLQSILVWAAMASNREDTLQSFDVAKGAALSKQHRVELERELFVEIQMWNTTSQRYRMPNGLKERELRWREMADSGFELAHIALQVYEPSTSQVYNPFSALDRIDQMARQGDTGAMCLYGSIAFGLPNWVVDWGPQWILARKWMEKGASLRHPECLIGLGGRLVLGSDGYAKDMNRGTQMLIEALGQGYLHGAGALWILSRNKGFGSAEYRRLEYCWGYQVAKFADYRPGNALEVYVSALPPEKRSALSSELNLLREWHPDTNDCINLFNNVQRSEK